MAVLLSLAKLFSLAELLSLAGSERILWSRCSWLPGLRENTSSADVKSRSLGYMWAGFLFCFYRVSCFAIDKAFKMLFTGFMIEL